MVVAVVIIVCIILIIHVGSFRGITQRKYKLNEGEGRKGKNVKMLSARHHSKHIIIKNALEFPIKLPEQLVAIFFTGSSHSPPQLFNFIFALVPPLFKETLSQHKYVDVDLHMNILICKRVNAF